MSKNLDKTNILDYLKEHYSEFKNKYNIEQIGLFGSYARDEATENSDIDIYVEFKHKTFDNLAGLWNYLEELYHKKIDLFHKHKNNNKVVISNIQKDVIYG